MLVFSSYGELYRTTNIIIQIRFPFPNSAGPVFYRIHRAYVVYSISFQIFFVHVFKIVVDSLKFSMLLLYILWDDWPMFMISGLNEQQQQELEYILLNPHCHSRWISKMQSGREETFEERYEVKLCFKLEKKCCRNI